MQSNSEKRTLGGRVWAAGFVGAIVGALVMGCIPSATGQTNEHIVSADTLTVELFLRKKTGKNFEFDGCRAIEATDTTRKPCRIDPEKSNSLSNAHFESVLVRWNGQSKGSGCAKVAGVEYCWGDD
jgi:hypothetical protein